MKNTKLNKSDLVSVKGSTIDTFGKVYFYGSRVIRCIENDYVQQCKDLFECGLIDELSQANMFPNSWIADYKIDGYNTVVEHERLSPINYPFEWSFAMLKDAAISVLKVNKIAKKYGYQTKDCHGFNIMFDSYQPKFIDLGSFDKRPLLYVDEFIRYYYYPLRIWSDGNSFIARRILSTLNEIMPHYSYKKYFKENVKDIVFRKSKDFVTKASRKTGRLLNLNLDRKKEYNYDEYIQKIYKMTISENSERRNYCNSHYTENSEMIYTERYRRITELIRRQPDIRTVTDLACNQAIFSRLLVRHTKVEQVIGLDYDENAIDKAYNSIKKEGNKNICVFLLNFMMPNTMANSINDFPHCEGRFKSDAVVALAITHHLLLSQKYRRDYILKCIGNYARKYVFVEFMPLGLWNMNKESCPPVPEWYTLDWFRSDFASHFNILTEEKLETNRILFVGEKKLP